MWDSGCFASVFDRLMIYLLLNTSASVRWLDVCLALNFCHTTVLMAPLTAFALDQSLPQ